jgi:hypothetical protein
LAAKVRRRPACGASLPEADRRLGDLVERSPTDPRVFISLGKVVRHKNWRGGEAHGPALFAEALAWFDRAAALSAGRAEALRKARV